MHTNWKKVTIGRKSNNRVEHITCVGKCERCRCRYPMREGYQTYLWKVYNIHSMAKIAIARQSKTPKDRRDPSLKTHEHRTNYVIYLRLYERKHPETRQSLRCPKSEGTAVPVISERDCPRRENFLKNFLEATYAPLVKEAHEKRPRSVRFISHVCSALLVGLRDNNK